MGTIDSVVQLRQTNGNGGGTLWYHPMVSVARHGEEDTMTSCTFVSRGIQKGTRHAMLKRYPLGTTDVAVVLRYPAGNGGKGEIKRRERNSLLACFVSLPILLYGFHLCLCKCFPPPDDASDDADDSTETQPNQNTSRN